MWWVFTNSSIFQEFHNHHILVGSWDFVIQEIGIGYTGTGIKVCGFVVIQVYVYYEKLLKFYDKKLLVNVTIKSWLIRSLFN